MRAGSRLGLYGQTQLRRVGQRIATVADKPAYKWEFNVIQGKEINAFALPGGRVAFWEGIMPVAQDDNGIAVIMGLEVAHALARQGAELTSQTMGAEVITRHSASCLFPWGRTQESEATVSASL